MSLTQSVSDETREKINTYLTSTNLDKSQLVEFANYVGFDNLDEFLNVCSKQVQAIDNLRKEFNNISSVNLDSLKLAISNVRYKLHTSEYRADFMAAEDFGLREDILANC
jgi:hypothetical protein